MQNAKNKAVFLDRDGVINKPLIKNGKPFPPKTLEDFEILPGVSHALHALKKEGFILIVVTNQPDVLRGTQKKHIVESMHDLLMRELPIDEIQVCYDENSSYYKPSPRMILDSVKKHQICLGSSYLVGDRWRDIGAGAAAGCKTIWIENDYNEKLTQKPDYIAPNLKKAAEIILETQKLKHAQAIAEKAIDE